MPGLLRLAEWWCGQRDAALVFEPLLADWQRELDAARHAGRARYVMAIASGVFAYARSFVKCTLTTTGWLPTSRAAQIVALTIFFAFDAALFLLWIVSLPSGYTRDMSSLHTRYFLLSSAGLAFAPIMLPALLLMRRDARSTARHAASVIAIGAVLTAAAVMLSSPRVLNGYLSTFELFEGEHQRNLANDRAGRFTYPGTAVRQLQPTTREQRRAAFERFQAWRQQNEAKAPVPTAQQHLRRMQPVALAILFGVMGWTLAGLGPATFSGAALWWVFIYGASLAFGAMPRALSGIPLRGVPYEFALPMFGAVTAALVIASWRHPST
jgi:hypothetical protein